jgi:hypothetical protein
MSRTMTGARLRISIKDSPEGDGAVAGSRMLVAWTPQRGGKLRSWCGEPRNVRTPVRSASLEDGCLGVVAEDLLEGLDDLAL